MLLQKKMKIKDCVCLRGKQKGREGDTERVGEQVRECERDFGLLLRHFFRSRDNRSPESSSFPPEVDTMVIR